MSSQQTWKAIYSQVCLCLDVLMLAVSQTILTQAFQRVDLSFYSKVCLVLRSRKQSGGDGEVMGPWCSLFLTHTGALSCVLIPSVCFATNMCVLLLYLYLFIYKRYLQSWTFTFSCIHTNTTECFLQGRTLVYSVYSD